MDLYHEDVTSKIIGAGITVLNELKPGLDEKLYENALVIELLEHNLPCQQQNQYDVSYKGQRIGKLIPDLIVAEKVIVDTKVVDAFNERHIAQMIGYLAITGLKVGFLMNFKHARLEWRRIIR